MPYFNSTPEFRVLVKQNGQNELQVRYINESQGYKGKWQTVPIVYESKPITSTS